MMRGLMMRRLLRCRDGKYNPEEENMHNRVPIHGRSGLCAVGLTAGVALLLQLAPAAAQNTSFLKGKTVRFIVGYSPGGGYDAYARMLAPHFEKRTGATVVVENKPGGGGMTAFNQLVRGKADGLSMQILNGESAVMRQLMKLPGVGYDMTKVSLLGRIQYEPHFFLVNPNLPDSLTAIVKSGMKLKFPATRRIDNLGDYAAVVCEALRMNCQIITGYKGSKEASLAVMNGEANALTISESSGYNYAKGGRMKIIATIAHKRSELKPKIPTVYEMFKMKPDERWWIDFRLSVKEVGRNVVAAPGIPADRLAALQKVWKEILTDPAVVAEGKKLSRELSYQSPAEQRKNIREVLGNMTPEKLKKLQTVLEKKFSS
jgi:putative tricarboxylic transport membrane protein